MRILFSILLLLVALTSFAADEKSARDVKPLTNEEVLNMQVQRTLQRERLIQKNKSDSLSSAQKTEKAKLAYAAAIKSYSVGDYATAKKSFEAAVQSDPENDQYYFDYAKNLYSQGNYKLGLSIFLMLESSSNFSEQAKFYQGLSFLKLKNDNLALKRFTEVQEDEDAYLSSSSAYYTGYIYYNQKNFQAAKKSFEFVIDKSKDPKLDDSAEKYLDLIVQEERNLAKLNKRFGYTLNVGTYYDGNVLNLAQENYATSLKAYRLSYGGSVFYNVAKTSYERIVPTFTFSDIYSLDSNFKSDSTIQSADPMILEFGIPYTVEKSVFGKSSTVRIAPSVQMIYMTKDTTKRELVYNNVILSSSLTSAYSSYFSMIYKLDISREQSYIEADSEDDDQTSQKYGATVSSYYLMDRARNENIFLDLSYLKADAVGVNMKYTKSLVSLGYSSSLGGAWSGYSKVDYFLLNYSESSTARKDTSISGYIAGTYSFNPTNAFTLGIQYQSNQSNVDSYKYNKMLVSMIYTYSSF